MVKPVALPINDANMLSIIRKLAQDPVNVFIKKHAKKRMKERSITLAQVVTCLQRGVIDEHAHEDISGDWKCTLRYQVAGDLVRVAAAIEKDDGGQWIAVVTVF